MNATIIKSTVDSHCHTSLCDPWCSAALTRPSGRFQTPARLFVSPVPSPIKTEWHDWSVWAKQNSVSPAAIWAMKMGEVTPAWRRQVSSLQVFVGPVSQCPLWWLYWPARWACGGSSPPGPEWSPHLLHMNPAEQHNKSQHVTLQRSAAYSPI